MNEIILKSCLLEHDWSGENWGKFPIGDLFTGALEGVKFWPMTGTLLGIAREGRHIEGSGDIDIAIAYEDISKIKDFGNGIVEYWNGIPVYWNYKDNPIINVQAMVLIKGRRYYISDNYIQYGIGDETCEQLLKRWYGKWETPSKGVHAKTKLNEINFSTYSC